MFFQIKAIRKRTKPPVWRRCFVPMGITFAQMAYILETLLELPVTDQYEFEFFQEKDRLIEGNRKGRQTHDFQFRYRDAVKACVNDWFNSKTWFTFRLKSDSEDLPQYRVEIEQRIGDVRLNKGQQMLNSPLIIKEVSYKEGDHYWTALESINQALRDTCFFKEWKAEYPSFSSVLKRVRQGKGMISCQTMKSQENLINPSSHDLLKKIVDSLDQIHNVSYESDQEKYFKERTSDTAFSAFKAGAYMTKSTMPKKLKSVEEALKTYSKASLIEIAEEYGLKLYASSRARMAFELACNMMEPKFMKEKLLYLDAEELDAFEEAIQRGSFVPNGDELYKLRNIQWLNYIVEFTNGVFQVPEDAAIVYTNICAHGYREYHRKAKWLIDCLHAYSSLYAVGNADPLYKLYCQSKHLKTDRAEFDSIMSKIPDNLSPCKIIGNRIVAKQAFEEGVYRDIEAFQRPVPYYIPSESAIKEYSIFGYPASDTVYQKLQVFFEKEMKAEQAECGLYCFQAFEVFSKGGMISDYVDFLNDQNLIFESDKQIEKFTRIITELNNNTRKVVLKGHTPKEMKSFGPKMNKSWNSKYGPESSQMLKLLEMERNKIGFRGSNGDMDVQDIAISMPGRENGMSGDRKNGTRKIYPNDPCPCGSGKKFKKCCGRKR